MACRKLRNTEQTKSDMMKKANAIIVYCNTLETQIGGDFFTSERNVLVNEYWR